MSNLKINKFIDTYYNHFNARELKDASISLKKHFKNNGKLLITLGGAMSTAEIGKILAEMIRQDKIHAISCTGANLEEDIFNAVANKDYFKVSKYRDLTPEDESDLLKKHLNRVTDTCIPEEKAIKKTLKYLYPIWEKASKDKKQYFPHEYIYKLLDNPLFLQEFQIDEKDSWVLAAKNKNLPIFVPGWEDSSLGNLLVAQYLKKSIDLNIVLAGYNYMILLYEWYSDISKKYPIGFFQIGGGISGDFPICVVPMINQDLQTKGKVPLWSYFCQISDATTSYGSYSGAVPNEKITWGKLGKDTPKYMIESDATIVAPLIFAYVLDW